MIYKGFFKVKFNSFEFSFSSLRQVFKDGKRIVEFIPFPLALLFISLFGFMACKPL